MFVVHKRKPIEGSELPALKAWSKDADFRGVSLEGCLEKIVVAMDLIAKLDMALP